MKIRVGLRTRSVAAHNGLKSDNRDMPGMCQARTYASQWKPPLFDYPNCGFLTSWAARGPESAKMKRAPSPPGCQLSVVLDRWRLYQLPMFQKNVGPRQREYLKRFLKSLVGAAD